MSFLPENPMSWEVLSAQANRRASRALAAIRKESEVRETTRTPSEPPNPWGKRSDMYAAATSTRLTGGWFAANTDVNKIIAASSPPVRARVRQLVRDFPYFKRAKQVITDYTVGPEIVFQSRIRTADGKRFDKKLIQQMEDAFEFWKEEADFSGRLHYADMMRLAKDQDSETGEFIIIKRTLRDSGRYLPYCLQMVEADWLTDRGATPVGGPKTSYIDQGIEYDKMTGRVIAYHFTDPDGWGRVDKVLARDVIHGFEPLRPGQLRGISPFVTAVILAKDLNDYIGATVDIAKLAAKWLAIIETPDPMSRQLANTVVPTALSGLTVTDSTAKIEYLENAIIEYLRPGEKMTLSQNPNPSGNFAPFVKLILCMVAITTGIPYELLSADYEGLNYSVSRAKRNDFTFELRTKAVRHIRHFCLRTFRPFVDAAVLAGKLPFQSYFTNPAPYLRGEWMPPGMESIDIARETKALIDQIKSGLRSPQEVAASRGRDLEEIYEEIKAAKELAEELKLDLDLQAVSTALANNPAAIQDQDGGTKKGASNNDDE